jgi:hypothetical protein
VDSRAACVVQRHEDRIRDLAARVMAFFLNHFAQGFGVSHVRQAGDSHHRQVIARRHAKMSFQARRQHGKFDGRASCRRTFIRRRRGGAATEREQRHETADGIQQIALVCQT